MTRYTHAFDILYRLRVGESILMGPGTYNNYIHDRVSDFNRKTNAGMRVTREIICEYEENGERMRVYKVTRIQ